MYEVVCVVFAGKIKVTEVIQDYMKGCACVLPMLKRKSGADTACRTCFIVLRSLRPID